MSTAGGKCVTFLFRHVEQVERGHWGRGLVGGRGSRAEAAQCNYRLHITYDLMIPPRPLLFLFTSPPNTLTQPFESHATTSPHTPKRLFILLQQGNTKFQHPSIYRHAPSNSLHKAYTTPPCHPLRPPPRITASHVSPLSAIIINNV